MPSDAATSFLLVAEVTGLDAIILRLDKGLFAINALDKVVDKYAIAIQAQGVANVSGNQVTYSGTTFVVNRVTGKLAQSFQIVNPAPLTRVVLNTANYASDVETGIRSYDMKPGLMGKTIPITDKVNGKKIARRDGKGRVRGYDYISFRRVSATSKGWIHPGMAPRPFLQAAAEKWNPAFQAEIQATLAKYIEGGNA